MGILTQHSHGKSDKIDTLIQNNLTSGVILSPRGESSPAKMIEVINKYASEDGFQVLFDPHFHLGLIENCPDAKIKDYPYYKSGLQPKDFTSPKKIIEYVTTTLDFQNDLNVSGIISPTCIIETFENCLASTLMAQSSIEHCADNSIDKDLYVSFVISDNAFRGSKEAMDDFITTITGVENLNKIYLVINRTQEAYSPQIEHSMLQNILYFIYSLSNRNGIEIICGYSDLIGLLYLSVGAKSLATGWSQKARFFSRNNYKIMTGGSQPKQRYTSNPLINTIFNIPELQTMERLGFLDDILSGTNYDNIVRSNPASDAWNKTTSFYHHMESINKFADELYAIEDADEKIELMLDKINTANALYKKLTTANVPFDQHTGGTHLTQWSTALENLKDMIT